MRRRHPVALLLLAAGIPLSAAQADSLDTVVVTATRTRQPLSEALSSVDVISRDELDQLPAADVADALRLQAGVEIARTGGPGQQTSLFLRGTNSNHVLVLVDGVRINPGTIGSAAIQNVTPDMIERVEIVKGPQSTLYGSDAIGGVINIITRKGAQAGTSVEAGLGSFGTRTAGLSAATSLRSVEASLAAHWLDSAGFPTLAGDTTNRGYRNLSVNGSVTADLGDWQVMARAWRAAGTSEYSDFFVTPVDQDFVTSAAALEATTDPAASWHTKVVLGHATDRIDQNQSSDFLRTRRWQLDWQNDLALGDHNAVTLGMLLQREDASSESFGLPFDARTDSRLVYLQDQLHFGTQQLLLAAGHTEHETYGGHYTWNAEYGLELGNRTGLWVAGGTAFRSPDATDLYGYGGNPDLRPETSRSVEFGLRSSLAANQQLTLVTFRNDIRDLIQYVVTNYTTYEGENRNVSRARITGIEAAWHYQRDAWSARLGATLQDPRDLSTDQQLLRRARQNYTLALTRHFGPGQLSLDVLAAGPRHDFGSPAPARLAGYTLVGLSAKMVLAERWTLTARIENLLNERYQLARGYNTMDRSLFTALRYDFH